MTHPHSHTPFYAVLSLNVISHSASRPSSMTALSDNPDTPGPLKAKGKMAVRKASTENLLDNDKKSSGPQRASSMEDIHTLSKKQSSGKSGGSGMGGKIVDAVVKVYQPDHTHKYIDISPVSSYG